MNVQNIFYGIGALFVIVAVLYFAFTFLQDLSDGIKLILLTFSFVGSFVIAELLRMGDH